MLCSKTLHINQRIFFLSPLKSQYASCSPYCSGIEVKSFQPTEISFNLCDERWRIKNKWKEYTKYQLHYREYRGAQIDGKLKKSSNFRDFENILLCKRRELEQLSEHCAKWRLMNSLLGTFASQLLFFLFLRLSR